MDLHQPKAKNSSWCRFTCYSPLVGVGKLVPTLTVLDRWLLAGLTVVVGVFSVYMVWSLQNALHAARQRVSKAYENLAEKVRAQLDELDKTLKRTSADVSNLLTSVLVGGGLLAFWLLLCRLEST